VATAPSSPSETTLGQALAIVEKKMRNLEKRKGKLDGYRESCAKGKPLNEDQKLAVSKYEEVIGTLEALKELNGQFIRMKPRRERSR